MYIFAKKDYNGMFFSLKAGQKCLITDIVEDTIFFKLPNGYHYNISEFQLKALKEFLELKND